VLVLEGGAVSEALIYSAGFVSPFLLLGVYVAASHALADNHGFECVAGDLEIPTRRMSRLRLEIVVRWHLMTAGRNKRHRAAVAAYKAKWG
jgi:hypothetical protein